MGEAHGHQAPFSQVRYALTMTLSSGHVDGQFEEDFLFCRFSLEDGSNLFVLAALAGLLGRLQERGEGLDLVLLHDVGQDGSLPDLGKAFELAELAE